MSFLFSFFIRFLAAQRALLTGVITSFGLWLDGVQILNCSSTQRFFVVDGLEPWSRHALRLQACTARGCAKGPVVSWLIGSHPSIEQTRSVKVLDPTRNLGNGANR